MKGIITQKNFKKGLNIVEKVTCKRLSLPILENILIEAEENFLKLSVTNLEIGVICWVLAKIEKPGKFLLPGKFLNDFINLLPEDVIEFEINENKNLVFVCGDYRAEIRGSDINEFPIIPKYEGIGFIEIDNLSFIRELKDVVAIASDSQDQIVISGIYTLLSEDFIEIVATDSCRLIKSKLFLTKKNRKEVAVIIPKKTAMEIVSILDNLQRELKIYTSPTQILLEVLGGDISQPQISIISRLLEGEYPNYKEIIPLKSKTRIIISKEEFTRQVKIMGLFCKKDDTIRLKINKKDGVINFFSQQIDVGQGSSCVKAEIEGENVEVLFNYKFLIDGIAKTKGQKIIFELNGQDQPGVFKSIEDKDYIYLVMPIRE
jgi:DNA polymerase-3 subunit beta